MTAQKHLKQLVRARMLKTGERYAAARRMVLGNGHAPRDGAIDPKSPTQWHVAGSVPATVALRVLVSHAGLEDPASKRPFSEPMLFGIAGGIGIGVCQFFYEKADFSSFFAAGRHLWHDDQAYLEGAIRALGLKCTIEASGGAKAAEKKLTGMLSRRRPVVAWCDMAMLPHRGMPAWMAGSGYHVVTVYDVETDGKTAVIGDMSDEPIRIAMADLTASRLRIKKHKCRLMQVDEAKKSKLDLKPLVFDGLKRCRDLLLKPAMKSMPAWFRLESIKTWAERVHGDSGKDSWSKVFRRGAPLWSGLTGVYDFIENYGTGGGLCRPIFAEFLTEAGEALADKRLIALSQRYREIGERWSELAAAALPDDVPAFAQARKLLDQRNESITTADGSAGAIWAELESLKKAAGEKFPLSEADCDALRARLKPMIAGLYDLEITALDEIGRLVA
jgi:hypothetical protein